MFEGEGILPSCQTCSPVESRFPRPDIFPGKNRLSSLCCEGWRVWQEKSNWILCLFSLFLYYLVQQLGHLEINVLCMLYLADWTIDLLNNWCIWSPYTGDSDLEYCFGNHSTGFSFILDFVLLLEVSGLCGPALNLLASLLMIKTGLSFWSWWGKWSNIVNWGAEANKFLGRSALFCSFFPQLQLWSWKDLFLDYVYGLIFGGRKIHELFIQQAPELVAQRGVTNGSCSLRSSESKRSWKRYINYWIIGGKNT